MVKIGFLLRGSSRPQKIAECADQGKIDRRRKVPKGDEMLGTKPVHKVHGGNQASFGSGTANVREINFSANRIERANDATVKCDLGGEICQM